MGRLRAGHGWSVCVAAALACGSSPGDGGGDGGWPFGDGGLGSLGDGGADGIAAPVVLIPCPEGWQEVTDGGLTLCEPWPATIAAAVFCRGDEMPLPGETECTTVGSPCPPGAWPENLPPDRHIWYVDPAASANGAAGTPDKPFATPHAAYAAAADGDVIALAASTDPGPPAASSPLVLDRGIAVTFWGACPDQSTIHAQLSGIDSGVGYIELSNLSLAATLLAAGATVRVHDARLLGVHATAGLVQGQRVVTGHVSATGTDARIEMDRSLIVASGKDGPLLSARPILGLGDTLAVRSGAVVTIERSSLPCSQLQPTGGLVQCSWMPDVLVDGGALTISESLMFVSTLQQQGTLELSGVAVVGGPLTVAGGDVVVTDVAATSLQVTAGTVTASRTTLCTDTVASLLVEEATVTATDLAIRGACRWQGQIDPLMRARGVEVRRGGVLRATRVDIRATELAGVAAYGARGLVELDDLRLVDVGRGLCAVGDTACEQTVVSGLVAWDSASISATGFIVGECTSSGIVVAEQGEVELHRGAVSDNPIGAIVADPGFDLNKLTDRVLWINNAVNLDAGEVYLPRPLPEMLCSDNIDNDEDGASDCDDSDCAAYPACE